MRNGFGISLDNLIDANAWGAGPAPQPAGVQLEASGYLIELEDGSGYIELETD